MPVAVKIILVVICSYFLGNITFARPVSKAVNDDITAHGSGNPGTMNMMRTFGAKLGFLTLILDLLKGVVCCLCAYYIFGGKDGGKLSMFMEYVAGFCCFIGHLYPVIFKFKGGKGVATAAGIGFCLNPILMSIMAVTYFLVLLLCEIASLTSMTCVGLYVIIQTIFVCLSHNYWCLIPLWLILFFVIFAHRKNIVRMINHNENKMNIRKIFKKKNKSTSESEDKETKDAKVESIESEQDLNNTEINNDVENNIQK